MVRNRARKCAYRNDEATMRYRISGRAPSILAAGLAIMLTIAMQLLAAERARSEAAQADTRPTLSGQA